MANLRLSGLRRKPILTADGKRIGCVHEVHCDKGQVTALKCGPASVIERWTGKSEGRRIPWACVRKVDDKAVTVDIGAKS